MGVKAVECKQWFTCVCVCVCVSINLLKQTEETGPAEVRSVIPTFGRCHGFMESNLLRRAARPLG